MKYYFCGIFALCVCGCSTNYSGFSYSSIMQTSDSKLRGIYQQDLPNKQVHKRTSGRNTFFSRDSILEQSHLALESALSDLDSNRGKELRAAHEAYKKEIITLSDKVIENWGNDEVELTSQDSIIKYSDHYLSRSKINFSNGSIRVETVDKNNPEQSLQNAIVSTLLTPDDPRNIDLYSDSAVKFGGKPFLSGLIKDNEGKEVLYEWRAKKYAQYLVQNKLKTRKDSKNDEVYYVDLQMEGNYAELAGNNYQAFVKKYAKKYNLQPALLMAIIRTESNFNPYAMSYVPAFGLMQVVPSTAGADSHELITGQKGTPSKQMLFTPETNIHYGSAYLHILYTRYLKDIKNPQSQEYCVIAAYNTGSGNVLRAFHNDRNKAIDVINSLSPKQVYKKLASKLQKAEAREYVQKVSGFKKQYIGAI